ncbi:DUF4405 domain-containing protein [Enterocloster clostridioformis]|uniref:DUF4405 domain-containing protein n=1 Tax=Enterocloster clostridioformis TaxID=1531 RepID=UPI0007406D9D|nr:DUF4405 domain-containing protein [Enterocloster clostridioformis]CUX74394.1 hypothetical protein BN3589_03615 [Clostridium sp. C105KSO14]
MNTKKRIKMIVDFMMVIVLLFLMTYSLVGETVHEVLGIAMFILLVIHHVLNAGWYKGIIKGKYNAVRITMTITNMAMLVLMLLQIIAGIVLSKHVFSFMGLTIGTGTFRLIHLAVPYWLFVLTSFHLGLHWKMMLTVFSRGKTFGKKSAWICRIIVIGVSVYGVYAFIRRQFSDYMFLKSQFAFFDFSEPLARFIVDYLAVMILFVAAGYYLMKVVGVRNRKGLKQS